MAPRVTIKVELDQRPVTDGLKRLQASFKTSFGEIQAALNLAKRAFGPLVGAIGDMIKAANESEKAQRGLAAALRLHGAESSTALRSMQSFNSSLQAQIGLDDDAAAALQTKLLALGVLPSQLERATRATIGLSDATGRDLTRASREVAKAFQESGQRAQELEALFSISEAQAATFAGQTKILGANMGELQETLGKIITGSPALQDALQSLNRGLSALNEGFSSRTAERWFDGLIRGIQRFADEYSKSPFGPAGAFGALVRTLGSSTPTDPNQIPQSLRDYERRLMGQKFPSGGGGASRGRGGGSRKGGRSSLADLSSEASSILGGSSITEQWAIEEESRQAHAEAMRAIGEAQLQQEIELNERAFQADLKAFDERQTLREREVSKVVHHIGGFVASTVSAWASGEASLAEAAKSAFGAMLAQIGQGLIALGSSAIAAGILGIASPIFAPSTGGPAAVAAGAGLVAAGATLVGFGGLAQKGARAGSGASGRSASSPSLPANAGVRGFEQTRAAGREPHTTIINLSIGHFVGGGSPAAAGRALRDLIQEANRSLVGGPAFAGAWSR